MAASEKPDKLAASYYLLLTAIQLVLAMGLLYTAEHLNLYFVDFYRYYCIVPILLVAYGYGPRLALLSSVFYSLAFLPRIVSLIHQFGFVRPVYQLLILLAFFNICGYVVADMLASGRTYRALRSTVRDWETLISKTSALSAIVSFVVDEARQTFDVEDAALLVRNPLDTQWEIITSSETRVLEHPVAFRRSHQSMAQWLLAQREPVLLNRLNQDARFIQTASEEQALQSLLAHPLYHQDGVYMGSLILLNKLGGEFTPRDVRILRDLAARSEKALEQAGLYARTDYALARRVKELAIIQRTARELNASLDPEQILERTLDCALEITEGEAGLVSLDMAGLPRHVHIQGANLTSDQVSDLLEDVADLDQGGIIAPIAGQATSLLPAVGVRIAVPIRRADRDLGVLVVESSDPQAFDESLLYVLLSLNDHAAITLENARLFREIRQEKQRASLIIHSVADGLFTTDRQRRVLTLNPAAEELTGWREEECVGRSCREVLGCKNSEEICKYQCPLAQSMDEQRIVYDRRRVIRQHLGTQRVILLSAAPLLGANGEPTGSVALFRDITEKEEWERLQQEFISAISHQVRGPLTSIGATTEMIRSEFENLNPVERQECINILWSQSRRLVSFADRLLDLFRLEAGHWKPQIRPLPIGLLAGEIVSEWSAMTPDHLFAVHTPDKSPWVWGDEKEVRVVLNNFLDNAVKYSAAGTKIEVRITQDRGGYVTVYVEDQGIGISPAHQVKIFERFYRVDGSDAQKVYGHGLGLYVAKRLVEGMRGQIWVESELGVGTRVAFTLPVMEGDYAEEDIGG